MNDKSRTPSKKLMLADAIEQDGLCATICHFSAEEEKEWGPIFVQWLRSETAATVDGPSLFARLHSAIARAPRDEVAPMSVESDWIEEACELMDECRALTARQTPSATAPIERDAARYRWIRNRGEGDLERVVFGLTKDKLDEAVDEELSPVDSFANSKEKS